jgi:hypothetical protein
MQFCQFLAQILDRLLRQRSQLVHSRRGILQKITVIHLAKCGLSRLQRRLMLVPLRKSMCFIRQLELIQMAVIFHANRSDSKSDLESTISSTSFFDEKSCSPSRHRKSDRYSFSSGAVNSSASLSKFLQADATGPNFIAKYVSFVIGRPYLRR